MKLAAASHAQLQSFLRDHLHDEALIVPSIRLYTGTLADFITRTFKIGAITFGRCVIVSPALARRDEANRLLVPGWLVAHEAVHVLQYRRKGFLRFFISYLYGYACALLKQKKWGTEARINAYLAIEEEREAREAERAYRAWRAANK